LASIHWERIRLSTNPGGHSSALMQQPTGDEGECRVLSGTFALLVQGFLGAWVLATLFYKRQQEKPRRDWKIWFMDSSKQGVAMGMQHFVNVALAVLFAAGETQAGECIWYITNFCITVFCGLFILAVYMWLHAHLVRYFKLEWLKSGEYGNPPQWRRWFVQMLLWSFVCCAEKFLTAGVVIFPLHNHIDEMIAELETPIRGYPRSELVLVMVALPTCLNVLFAWVVDNLIKGADTARANAQGTQKEEGDEQKGLVQVDVQTTQRFPETFQLCC